MNADMALSMVVLPEPVLAGDLPNGRLVIHDENRLTVSTDRLGQAALGSLSRRILLCRQQNPKPRASPHLRMDAQRSTVTRHYSQGS